MMPFWTAVLLLLLLVFIGVFARGPGRRTGGRPAIQATVGVYRQHLAELSADLAQGRLTREQFDGDRAEIERRLALDLRAGTPRAPTNTPGGGAVAVYWLGMVLLVAALLLYLALGAPALAA